VSKTRQLYLQAEFGSNLRATMGYHISCFEFSSPWPHKVAMASCSAVLEFESERNLLTTKNNYHMLAVGGELLSDSAFRAEETLSVRGDAVLIAIRIILSPAQTAERECL